MDRWMNILKTANAKHVGLYFVPDRHRSDPVDLSESLTLEPQLAALIRLHCLNHAKYLCCLNSKSNPH